MQYNSLPVHVSSRRNIQQKRSTTAYISVECVLVVHKANDCATSDVKEKEKWREKNIDFSSPQLVSCDMNEKNLHLVFLSSFFRSWKQTQKRDFRCSYAERIRPKSFCLTFLETEFFGFVVVIVPSIWLSEWRRRSKEHQAKMNRNFWVWSRIVKETDYRQAKLLISICLTFVSAEFCAISLRIRNRSCL